MRRPSGPAHPAGISTQHDRQKRRLTNSTGNHQQPRHRALLDACSGKTHDPPENLLAGIIWREKGSCTQNRWFSTAKRLIEDKPHIDLRPNSLITCSRKLGFPVHPVIIGKAHFGKPSLSRLTIEQVNLFGATKSIGRSQHPVTGVNSGLHHRHWALRQQYCRMSASARSVLTWMPGAKVRPKSATLCACLSGRYPPPHGRYPGGKDAVSAWQSAKQLGQHRLDEVQPDNWHPPDAGGG